MLEFAPMLAAGTFLYVLGGFILLALIQSTMRQLLYPDREVDYETLPASIRKTLESLAGPLDIKQTIASFHAKERLSTFRLIGQRAGKPLNIEVELDSSGTRVKEYEIDFETELSARRFSGKTPCSPEFVPDEIKEVVVNLLSFTGESPEITRAKSGTVQGETAFDLDGLAGKWKFELKILSDGTLLELELD